jgi:hypothetical protein
MVLSTIQVRSLRLYWRDETVQDVNRGVVCYERLEVQEAMGAKVAQPDWVISDWIASAQTLVRPLEASAAKYTQDKGITPRDCP